MTDQNGEDSIRWLEWGEDAFAASRQEGKPLLLTLTATWCHWCHVMDQTSYSDPRVIERINSGFIPVRVDVDRRPDISRRYNQGGYPSVAVLDGGGKLLAGRIYMPPDEMLTLLAQVSEHFPAPVPAAPGRGAATSRRAAGASQSPDERVRRWLMDHYDPWYGGFGSEPKQPPWEGLRFLLELYGRSGEGPFLTMVTDSLDGIIAGLYDQKDRGFFRYSVTRDWKIPHYEKMLVTNASLASLLLEACQVTGNAAYEEAAAGALRYLMDTLYDDESGLFHSSQDAWEDFYRLPWKDRDAAERPTVDKTAYTGWNACAASAFIKAGAVLGAPRHLKTAARTLEVLWSDLWEGELGFQHAAGGLPNQPRMLDDHVAFLRASLELFQADSDPIHLERAVQVAAVIDRLFGPAEGGYLDVAAAGAPSAEAPLAGDRPVLENSLLAEALAVLACLTGDAAYQERAALALSAFETIVPDSSFLGDRPSRRVEEDEEALFLPAGSAWARARQMLAEGPVHLVVVGASGNPTAQSLMAAGLRTYLPHRVLQRLDPEADRERIESLGFPLEAEPALYACMNGMCLAPIRSVREVERLLGERPWKQFAALQQESGPYPQCT